MSDNSNFLKSLKEMPPIDRALKILILAASIAVIVLASFQMFGIWQYAINVYMPLMGINMALEAVIYWKSSRGLAILNICTSVLVFICAVIVWL